MSAKTTITYANPLGEVLAPFLTFVRSLGFFEAPVYMTFMTFAAIILYSIIVTRTIQNNTFESGIRKRTRSMWLGACVFS